MFYHIARECMLLLVNARERNIRDENTHKNFKCKRIIVNYKLVFNTVSRFVHVGHVEISCGILPT